MVAAMVDWMAAVKSDKRVSSTVVLKAVAMAAQMDKPLVVEKDGWMVVSMGRKKVESTAVVMDAWMDAT